MFSEKLRYTLKTLAYLSTVDPEKYTTISDLTDLLEIPRGYLNRIVPELVELGYLNSKKGLGGGIKLARSPEDIQLRALLEDTGALAHRSEDSYENCCVPEIFDRCIIETWMTDFRDEVVSDSSLAELRDRLMEKD